MVCKKKSGFNSNKSEFEAGGIVEKISEPQSNNPNTVYIFYAPWCGFCKKSMDEFEKAELEGHGKVKLVDSTDEKNKDLLSKFKVEGYPTIVKSDGTKFEGSRIAADILKFANYNSV